MNVNERIDKLEKAVRFIAHEDMDREEAIGKILGPPTPEPSAFEKHMADRHPGFEVDDSEWTSACIDWIGALDAALNDPVKLSHVSANIIRRLKSECMACGNRASPPQYENPEFENWFRARPYGRSPAIEAAFLAGQAHGKKIGRVKGLDIDFVVNFLHSKIQFYDSIGEQNNDHVLAEIKKALESMTNLAAPFNQEPDDGKG